MESTLRRYHSAVPDFHHLARVNNPCLSALVRPEWKYSSKIRKVVKICTLETTRLCTQMRLIPSVKTNVSSNAFDKLQLSPRAAYQGSTHLSLRIWRKARFQPLHWWITARMQLYP